MINRNDYAKKFELVVQQEVKNYQDSLNFVLQSLKNLKSSVDDIRQEISDSHAVLHNQIKLSEIRTENLERSHENHKKFSEKKLDDNSLATNFLYEKISNNSKEQQEISRHIEKIFDRIDTLKIVVNNFTDIYDKKYVEINSKIESIRLNMLSHVDKTKNEIINLPSQAQSIKSDLEEKINTHSVDVKGLLKEIRINRKDIEYIEKKIENIYTLIERLQKKEAGL